MKFLVEKYKVISIWLSLAILALAFYIGSDEECRAVCVPLALLLGTLLHLLGSTRELACNRMVACLIETVLTVVMVSGLILSLLGLGGVM